MDIILRSLVVPVAIFLGNVICKQKHRILVYVLTFLTMLLFQIFYFSKAEATEITPPISHEQVIKVYYEQFLSDCSKEYERENRKMSLNYTQRQEYMRLCEEHEYYGKLNLSQAKEKCCLFPRVEDRNMAEYCFNTILATISQSTPMSRIVAAIISMFGTYGLNVMREWNEINTHLNYAQYHYEMKEFYEMVLIKA